MVFMFGWKCNVCGHHEMTIDNFVDHFVVVSGVEKWILKCPNFCNDKEDKLEKN